MLFRSSAGIDPDRREALRARRRAVRVDLERVLTEVAGRFGIDLPLPVPDLAVLLLALSNGLAVESGIDPDAVPDDLLARVLTLLAGDAAALLRRPSPGRSPAPCEPPGIEPPGP